MFYMLNKKKYILPIFQNITQIVKTSYYFNDSIRIINRNNFKT